MQITRWNNRRISIAAGAILVFYLMFSASWNTYQADVIIKNTNPELVWEYVADFDKMRLLNPTM